MYRGMWIGDIVIVSTRGTVSFRLTFPSIVVVGIDCDTMQSLHCHYYTILRHIWSIEILISGEVIVIGLRSVD